MAATESSFFKSTGWTAFVRKTKRVLSWFLTLLAVIIIAFIYWKYFYTYSEGYRTGLLQKFSKKGTIFKTYEGEMILSSVSSTSNVAIALEKFFFSVTNTELVPRFDTLQGETVIVHYIEKNGVIFWRGDSKYLVDSVRLKK